MEILRTTVDHLPDWVDHTTFSIIPETHLEEGDQVRVGFTKGTLAKATFELHAGYTITYEKMNDVLNACTVKAKDTSSRRTKTRINQHGPVFELIKDSHSVTCFNGRAAILVRSADNWVGWLPKDEIIEEVV